MFPVAQPGVKPGRVASCLPGTCAVGLVLARGRLMAVGESMGEYWREEKESQTLMPGLVGDTNV